MYVYLRWSGSYKRTVPVSLNLRKCMPVVGTYSEGRIDPALWFKVLVLDSVFIDIDRRKVFWTCQRPEDSILFKKSTSDPMLQYFDTQEEITAISDNCDFEYDPRMAELFGTARDIYERHSMDVFDKEGNVSTYEDLVKILHVFILPEVQFHVKDRTAIQRVFEAMENECQMVEMMINKKVNEKRRHEESLARQRRSLVKTEQMLGHLSNLFIDEEFNSLLLKHLEKDVKKLEDNMVSLSDRIVRLKRNKSDKCESKLAQARETRSKFVKEKERLIMVKEELRNRNSKSFTRARKSRIFPTRSRSLSKKQMSSASHQLYTAESQQLDITNEDIKVLINSKIKLSGVREAVHLTLTELDGDGVSYGYNRKKGAFEAEVDMFDPSKKPEEWKTLHEQVNEHLKLNHTELKTKHDRFCSKIRTKCRQLLTSSGITCSSAGVSSVSSEDSNTTSNFSVRSSVRWLSGAVPRDECETICTEISEHVLDVAYTLSDELHAADKCMPTYNTHLYICYEKHVAEDVMSELGEVYRESFRTKCESLFIWISTHAKTELDFIDKWMGKLFPDSNEDVLPALQKFTPTGSLPCHNTRRKSRKWQRENDLTRSSRLSRSVEHLPLNTLVDTIHAHNGGDLADTFDKAWRVISTEENRMERLKSLSQDDVIRNTFFDFFSLVENEITKCSIFDKLRMLSRAVQSLEEHSCDLLKKNGHSTELSTDDMLDLLIMVICRLDCKCLLSLYADINMIFHLTPCFLQGSMGQYCLISLTGAYQHLFECQEKLQMSTKELQ